MERSSSLFLAAVAGTALLSLAAVSSGGGAQIVKVPGLATSSPQRPDKVVLTPAEWRKRLTKEQYGILREKGTEPAFCGVNLGGQGPGVYRCAGCGLALFNADAKFKSESGWPSFFRPIANDRLWIQTDRSYNTVRTEILCARCDGHLGHVFDDGPKPTGLRYCLNGKVLKFIPAKTARK